MSRITAAVGLLLVSSLVTMSVPFALGKIIDIIYQIDQTGGAIKDGGEESDAAAVMENKKLFESRLRTFCLGLVGVFLVGGACNFGRVYLMRISGQTITARLREKLYSAIMRQNVTFFDRNKTGELINRLSADTQLVSQTITQQVFILLYYFVYLPKILIKQWCKIGV